MPVGELLARLAERTGVRLAAGPEVSDEKVVVFGPVCPAREVLTDLGAFFNARWDAEEDRRRQVARARALHGCRAEGERGPQTIIPRCSTGTDRTGSTAARPPRRDWR